MNGLCNGAPARRQAGFAGAIFLLTSGFEFAFSYARHRTKFNGWPAPAGWRPKACLPAGRGRRYKFQCSSQPRLRGRNCSLPYDYSILGHSVQSLFASRARVL
jgi:hypothetical protein